MSVETLQVRLALLENLIDSFEALCHRCRAGFYNECVADFDSEEFCPEGKVTVDVYVHALVESTEVKVQLQSASDVPAPKGGTVAATQPFDSGYIHPDAWRFTKNIGEFTDPESTGRKLVKRLYPIETGMVCEWARKLVLGLPGGPMVGCLGNPVTDWHHGPDKNTLNNQKMTWGVGEEENVHLICSPCHNKAHSIIDAHYPEYDRIEQQAQPWLPETALEWGSIRFEEADIDELLEEERRRLEAERRRGRETRGRNKAGAGVASDAREDED